ncbi:heme ABC transporter ATP-binding protein [Streptomyces sedi]|nr:heme ABC transporter ATP-binding protein [Streptomyces sedi]
MIRFRTRVAEPPRGPEAGAELAGAAGLAVRLGGRTVLSGIDLAVRAGEVLTLVGPNGAGKSTLLAALAADVAPAEGRLLVDGRPAGEWTPRELAFRRAVLPQAATVSFPFTVAEVVAMGRAPWAGTRREDEDEARVAEAMAATEVAEFADRPFGALSGGERARVALARVLAQHTALLLLDEPTAALDLRHQEQVMRVCREWAEAGRGVVVVLHDLGLAAAWADRVAVLRGGRLAAVGTPEEVFTEGLLGEVYGHRVRVLTDPETGAPLIVPHRPGRGGAAGADG